MSTFVNACVWPTVFLWCVTWLLFSWLASDCSMIMIAAFMPGLVIAIKAGLKTNAYLQKELSRSEDRQH